MNYITDFLCFDQSDELQELASEVKDDVRYIHVAKKLKPVYCPMCSYRMHSKGVSLRKVRHPIFQDGYKLVIIVHQRRWYCPNTVCGYHKNDEFTFVDTGKQLSNLTPFMILNALKDLYRTAASVAEQFHVSDTYVHNIVLTHLHFERLPLPRILSVDEVYLEFNRNDRYCLVLLDFETGQIVDILPNRYKKTFDDYFYAIDKKERDNVEVIITDMYGPYLDFPDNYFHKAKCIVDSFHVVSFLTRSINNYINKVLKKYQQIDNERRKERNYRTNSAYKTIKDSDEVKLLKNYRFFLLRNKDEIEYDSYRVFRKRFAAYYSTYELESKFMALDPNFERIRDLKEEYIAFNSEYFGKDEKQIEEKLDELIGKYSACHIDIFTDFADHLRKFKKQIILSFKDFEVTVKDEERKKLHRRLSNGPMEGFNRKPKDLKRNSRGVNNFPYTRNRILWSEREDAHILAVPKEEKDIHTYTEIKRGPYKKKAENKGNGNNSDK